MDFFLQKFRLEEGKKNKKSIKIFSKNTVLFNEKYILMGWEKKTKKNVILLCKTGNFFFFNLVISYIGGNKKGQKQNSLFFLKCKNLGRRTP